MEETFLYRQIAESLRQQILSGELRPGDRLPSIRQLAARWHCTQGTIQKAYRELSEQGLAVSRAGQGTHVAGEVKPETSAPLRWANVVHRAEAFLLEVLTAGYSPSEAEEAMRTALDRWRTLSVKPPRPSGNLLRFFGSHDPALNLIISRAGDIAPGYDFQVTFTGSLGGLMALARGETDLAGSHLWDEESDTYNAPFVRRLLPGRRVVLITLAHRHQGLIVPPGNPAGVTGLSDLLRPGLRFVNRQRGSGTRVWLDAQLSQLKLMRDRISGYGEEVLTHHDVAKAVAEGQADVGIGIAAVCRDYGLEFIPLTKERYDLVALAEAWEFPPIQALVSWLRRDESKAAIEALGGYDVSETGNVNWIE